MNNNLIGWWKMAGNPNDSSGNGNNASNNGSTLTTDRFGNSNAAYSFNGSTSQLIVASPATAFNLTGAFTITAWINPVNAGGGNRGRIFDRQSASAGFAFSTDNNNTTNGLGLYFNAGTTSAGVDFTTSGSNAVTNNVWQHVAVTYDGSSVVLFYVNGALFATKSLSQAITSLSTYQATIGGRSADTLRQFNGLMSDLRVFGTNLTANTIKQIYQEFNQASNFFGTL